MCVCVCARTCTLTSTKTWGNSHQAIRIVLLLSSRFEEMDSKERITIYFSGEKNDENVPFSLYTSLVFKVFKRCVLLLELKE